MFVKWGTLKHHQLLSMCQNQTSFHFSEKDIYFGTHVVFLLAKETWNNAFQGRSSKHDRKKSCWVKLEVYWFTYQGRNQRFTISWHFPELLKSVFSIHCRSKAKHYQRFQAKSHSLLTTVNLAAIDLSILFLKLQALSPLESQVQGCNYYWVYCHLLCNERL